MDWQTTLERLRADKGRWSAVARETGLHLNTVRNIALGRTPSPGIKTAAKIQSHYEQRQGTQ